jgi:hypothetical protein
MEYKTSQIEALRAGESRYIGRPCKYGHGTLRHTKTWDCMVCRKTRNKKLAQAAKKKAREIKRAITPPRPTPRADALAKGESTYIGSPCNYGHGTLKFTASYECAECARLRTAKTNEAVKIARAARGYKKPGRKPKHAPVEGFSSKQLKRLRRKTAQKERTPAWLTKDDKWMIREAYSLAALRTKLFGFPWEVDHIIPLRGEYVSGLHVPLNLQVIPKETNRKKGSSF